MFRLSILTAILAVGMSETASGQPFPRFPATPPPPPSVEGTWYMSGNPGLPCSIQIVRIPSGIRLVITNEKGEQSRGRYVPGGWQIVAKDWDAERGGLIGDIGRGGRVIRWGNGTEWRR